MPSFRSLNFFLFALSSSAFTHRRVPCWETLWYKIILYRPFYSFIFLLSEFCASIIFDQKCILLVCVCVCSLIVCLRAHCATPKKNKIMQFQSNENILKWIIPNWVKSILRSFYSGFSLWFHFLSVCATNSFVIQNGFNLLLYVNVAFYDETTREKINID